MCACVRRVNRGQGLQGSGRKEERLPSPMHIRKHSVAKNGTGGYTFLAQESARVDAWDVGSLRAS